MNNNPSSAVWILGGVGVLALIVLIMSRSATVKPSSPSTTQTPNTTGQANQPSAPVSTNTLAYDISALPTPTSMSQSQLAAWLLGEQHLSTNPMVYNGAAIA